MKKELLSATAKRSKQSKSTSNLGDASQTKASALAKKKKAKSTSKLSDLKASEAIKLEPVEIKSEPIEIKAEPIEIQTEHPLNDEARSRPKRQSRNLRTVNDGTTEEAKKSKQKRKT